MKILAFICALILVANCGGGAGGSGSSGSTANSKNSSSSGSSKGPLVGDPVNYPLIEPDPKWIGDQATFDGKTFKMTASNGKTLSFTPKSRDGYVYDFGSERKIGRTRFMPMAMSNRDALVVGVQLSRAGSFPEDRLFGYDGTWASKLNFAEKEYYGHYQVMSPDRKILGDYPMFIHLDMDSMRQSYGVDLVTGEEVKIMFGKVTDQSISATISDANSDQNPASFGFFGKDGRTLAGGYSWELGTGIMLVETK